MNMTDIYMNIGMIINILIYIGIIGGLFWIWKKKDWSKSKKTAFAGMFLILVMVLLPFINFLLFSFRPQQDASTSASIYLESRTENYTIYVPVLLDENKTVLKMYENPMITGSATTSLMDTEHGKALKISRSGLGDYVFNWNEVPGKDTDRFVKWIDNVENKLPGEKLDITKTDNGTTITVLGSILGSITASGRSKMIIRLNEENILEVGWGLFFAKEENGNLNIYSGKNEISMNESHGKLKEVEQTTDEFFKRFTISMSNYTLPESFENPSQYPESSSMFGAWVYSDSEIEKIRFHYYLDPLNYSEGRALSISTPGWVHLKKGWQVVNLSRGISYWD